MAGPETRERQEGQKPQQIISDARVYSITIPGLGIRVSLDVADDRSITTKVEHLTIAEEQRLAVETQFTQITRSLINTRLGIKAARLAPGSESGAQDLSAISLERQFDDAVNTLSGMGYSDRRVQELIVGQGRQFTIGETHMGEIPPIVKEEVVGLAGRVDELYREKVRRTRGERRR